MAPLQELRTLLHHILIHPNNRDQKIAAAFRLLKWQIWKNLLKRPVTVRVGTDRLFKVVCDSKFSSLVIYNRLPDWDEMNFLLRFLRPEDAFIDIGANVGFYTVLASTIIREQSILAIEANPRNAKIVREQVALNRLTNVRVLETALGDKQGKLLFEDSSRETGSLASAGDASPSHIRVPCSLLDDVLASEKITAAVVVAKMDVEGCEGMILEGARQTLEEGRVNVWLFELAETGLRRHGSSEEQLLGIFERHGYSILYWDEAHQRLGNRGDEHDNGHANYLACNNRTKINARLSEMT